MKISSIFGAIVVVAVGAEQSAFDDFDRTVAILTCTALDEEEGKGPGPGRYDGGGAEGAVTLQPGAVGDGSKQMVDGRASSEGTQLALPLSIATC